MLIEATTQTAEGNVYILQGDDDLHVGLGVTLTTTWSDPVSHTGADTVISWVGSHVITVEGTLIGADDAINLVGCVTAQTVTINATGVLISGGDGVVADADGVILDGLGSVLHNAGTITSYGSAASLVVPDGGTTTVTNSGTMTGRVAGVWHKWGTGTLVLTNTGVIESPGHAVLGGTSADLVTNRGKLRGLVDLGGGDDLLDTRGGTVTGAILGGDGDDRFVTGTGHETIDGGQGIDTLDFSMANSGVTVNLSDSALNAGSLALGDVYSGIETVLGTSKVDRLTGDTLDNTLCGNGSADVLLGKAGNDTLTGGMGKDTLTGGTGADDFVFTQTTGNADRIIDFAHAEDRILISAAAFGYGATLGPLPAADFVTATNTRALDATDRFIFRTTDQTLWYDRDGTGTAVAVLVADLQAGAVLTASDILLV
ncbi:MAG: hypothetical protein KBF78_09650 [Fuscovulum sp.]|jgi:Ca2+-binding RTX toxin-like protein|nr:hypothetical protein [Fuscovulum sp.]